ncbi:MAG: discoidin domain-containing protein, partial [Thermoguttaceae bacterium]|nr:discoidin domain-containing protein [Thermoguttaceae bacterium]
QDDRSLVERSHTELVRTFPHRYTIHVAGADHPIVQSLRISDAEAAKDIRPGYSDGRDVGGEKFVPRWVTYGKNLALGKPYTVSIPSGTNWGAGDPEGKKLTDGIIGPPYAGGIAASFGLLWTEGQKPAITVDLQDPHRCGAFRIHLTGYPFWDALKGEVRDQIEVLTSTDGREFTSQGFFKLDLRWKDLPANLMWPDEENATAPVFDLVLPRPVEARYVRFAVTARRFVQISEVQVLDRIDSKPFDLRIALP